MSSVVHIERRDGVHTLTLGRPDKMNALSAELVEALLSAVAEAEADAADVIVLRGEGKNFSAGFDFAGVDTDSEGDLLLRFVRIEMLLQALAQSPCLTVALAHGRNFGAGVDLIAACKVRVGTDATTFRMPGLKFGLVLGTRRYAALVGAQRAREVLEAAQTFTATQALQDGFLSRVCSQDAWQALVQEAADTARALPIAVRKHLYQVIAPATANDDLADLVRSAARPGLKRRIAEYLEASRPQGHSNQNKETA